MCKTCNFVDFVKIKPKRVFPPTYPLELAAVVEEETMGLESEEDLEEGFTGPVVGRERLCQSGTLVDCQ